MRPSPIWFFPTLSRLVLDVLPIVAAGTIAVYLLASLAMRPGVSGEAGLVEPPQAEILSGEQLTAMIRAAHQATEPQSQQAQAPASNSAAPSQPKLATAKPAPLKSAQRPADKRAQPAAPKAQQAALPKAAPLPARQTATITPAITPMPPAPARTQAVVPVEPPAPMAAAPAPQPREPGFGTRLVRTATGWGEKAVDVVVAVPVTAFTLGRKTVDTVTQAAGSVLP